MKTQYQRRDLLNPLTSLAGMAIYSIGLNLFIVPTGLYNGGIMGISQIIRTLLIRYAGFSSGGTDIAGIINLILNLPLLFLAYKAISKRFFLTTLICVAGQTFFLTLIPVPQAPLLDETLAACMIGGTLVGLGIGTALRSGGSSGGLDILGMYLTKKYQNISVGKLSLIVNIFIYLACAFLFSLNTALYCVIYSLISTWTIDRTHIQNINTEAFICTKEDPSNIINYIIHQLNRGATYWEAAGGYTGDKEYVIFTVVSKYEYKQLEQELHTIDQHAFLVSKGGTNISGRYEKHL